jgi:hypothetical protein
MPSIDLRLDGDNCWPDLVAKFAEGTANVSSAPLGVATLAGGMESGRPSVMLRIDLPDGKVALCETSLDLWLNATAAMRGRYEEAFPELFAWMRAGVAPEGGGLLEG